METREKNIWVVIPARYSSTRFPGKALALIKGRPMITRVIERVLGLKGVERVLVATDDERIASVANDAGAQAVMTGDHPTGTDRIAEAVEKATEGGTGPRWVLNVQGDEPLVDPGDLERLIDGLLGLEGALMGTLVYPISNQAEFQDPNVVKAVMDGGGKALYFSRAPIPHEREGGGDAWRHMGIYLFEANFLKKYALMTPTHCSQTEQLEQLRVMEHGFSIHCFKAQTFSIGVDVPGDIPKVEARLND